MIKYNFTVSQNDIIILTIPITESVFNHHTIYSFSVELTEEFKDVNLFINVY